MYSARFLLTAAVVALQIIALVVAVTLSYLASQRVLLDYAEELTVRVANDATAFTENFLDPADDAAALTQRLAESAVVETRDASRLVRYFYEVVRSRSDFAGIFYGGADGSFLFVSRDDTVRGAAYRIKRIVTEPERSVDLTYLDANFREVLTRSDPLDTYDFRERPWYRSAVAAKGVAWTDPYIFFTSKRPGITVATPVLDTNRSAPLGVVGIDIRIDALSRFLNELEIGETGAAAIVSETGNVVAHRNPSLVLRYSGTDAPPGFATVDDIDDAALKQAVEELAGDWASGLSNLRAGDTKVARFTSQGEPWRGAARRLRGEQTPWLVVTYLPEDDLVGPAETARNIGYLVSAVVAALSGLIAAFFARGFTQPLAAMARQANMITEGNFEDVGLPATKTRELDATRKAFRRATRWLREYRSRNEELTQGLRNAALDLEHTVERRTNELRETNEALTVANRRAELIAGEFNHRIKNLFATTGALVTMAARHADTPRDVQREAKTRIHALALAHSATQATQTAQLQTLVETVLAPFADRDDVRLNVKGEPIALRAALVTPIGLILFELATNAVKYGALHGTGGELQVSWNCRGDDGLSLEWSERGAGTSAIPAVEAGSDRDDRGQGSALIETLVNQLNGDLQRKITATGLDLSVAIPGPISPKPSLVS